MVNDYFFTLSINLIAFNLQGPFFVPINANTCLNNLLTIDLGLAESWVISWIVSTIVLVHFVSVKRMKFLLLKLFYSCHRVIRWRSVWLLMGSSWDASVGNVLKGLLVYLVIHGAVMGCPLSFYWEFNYYVKLVL